MPRVCSICNHADRAGIESALVAGGSLRDIARQFGVSKDAIARHTDHIAEHIQASQEAKEEARSIDVVSQLQQINGTALEILKESRELKEHELALKAMDRICKQLELQAKLLGAIDRPQINVLVSPEWQLIRDTIIAALLPYPEARIAVAAALSQLEEERARLN